MTTTLTTTLTATQTQNWEDADWGMGDRHDNQMVAKTVIAMLEEGIAIDLIVGITSDRDRLMSTINERSEVYDIDRLQHGSDARETVLWVLNNVWDGRIPYLEPEDDEDEDEDEEDDL